MARTTQEAPVPLTRAEEALIRALARATITLPRAFEADLLREQRMALNEYFTLMHLSEAPDRRMRMSELAAAADLSLSGMTRIVTRLGALGLVRRERAEDDGRSIIATLTDAGLERLREAWPAHLASVRRHIFDHVDPAVVPVLTAALQRMAADCTCEPSGRPDRSTRPSALAGVDSAGRVSPPLGR